MNGANHQISPCKIPGRAQKRDAFLLLLRLLFLQEVFCMNYKDGGGGGQVESLLPNGVAKCVAFQNTVCTGRLKSSQERSKVGGFCCVQSL